MPATALRRTVAAPALAEVSSVRDPDGLGRVQVRLLGADGPEGQDAPLWARVAVPFAGGGRGAFLLPDVGDEVLVCFADGDPRLPIVVGGLWSGSQQPPESLSGNEVDRWSFTGKAGTRVAIVEDSEGPTISFETPNGVSGTLTESGGGKIELSVMGSTTVTLEQSGVTIQTGGTVKVQGSKVDLTAGMVKVDSALADFTGIVKCSTLQATTVIASTYTPGAGNIW